MVLNAFLDDAHKYCFSLVPANFIGFGVSSSIIEKLNDMIKSKIPFSKTYKVTVQKLVQFFNEKAAERNSSIF